MKRKVPREQELKVEILRGRLVISIGVETLAFACQHSPDSRLTPYDDEARTFTATKVTDPDVFAAEVALALKGEAEDGTTLVHTLLDDAMVAAIEDGCEGVDHDGH